MRSAAVDGHVGLALDELVAQQQQIADIWSDCRQALAYPLLVLLLLVPMFLLFCFVVLPPLEELFIDFDLELPEITVLALSISHNGPTVFAWLVVGTMGVAALLRFMLGRAGWHMVRSCVPLFGMLYVWCGLAERLHTLAVLLAHHVPLPQALREAAQRRGDAYLGKAFERLAKRVEAGESFSDAVAGSRVCLPSLAALVAWGGEHDQLAGAVAIAGENCANRARLHMFLITGVLSPLIFVLTASLLFFLLFAMFLPLIQLISSLT